MQLHVQSTTLREVMGQASSFPAGIRQELCNAVGAIDADKLNELLSKHETDHGNFDGTVEDELRRIVCYADIKANCCISDRTKFNNDLLIETGDAMISLEIEKGNASRFEFDVLKMAAVASARANGSGNKPVFGAFIVPVDNIVARHITGNSGESSFEYITRLFRLVAQIESLGLSDILLIGYGMSAPVTSRKRRATKGAVVMDQPKSDDGNIESRDKGLVALESLQRTLRDYPTELLLSLRQQLAKACPDLKEKLNTKSRYLGYGLVGCSYNVYVYVQKKNLLIDIRLSPDHADAFRKLGFEVRPRDNYQAKAGWLTGVFVPHDTERRAEVAALILKAIREREF